MPKMIDALSEGERENDTQRYARSLGEWFRSYRKEILGLTQEELAEQAHLSVETIQKIEAGERRPAPRTARALAEAMGFSPEDYQLFTQYLRGGLVRVHPTAPVTLGLPELRYANLKEMAEPQDIDSVEDQDDRLAEGKSLNEPIPLIDSSATNTDIQTTLHTDIQGPASIDTASYRSNARRYRGPAQWALVVVLSGVFFLAIILSYNLYLPRQPSVSLWPKIRISSPLLLQSAQSPTQALGQDCTETIPPRQLSNETMIPAGTAVTVSFRVRNHQDDAVHIPIMVGAVRGPNGWSQKWDAANQDFSRVRDIEILPQAEYVYEQTQTFYQPGEYFVTPTLQNEAGKWGGISPWPTICFVVTQ